ncbi:HAD family hydrolase [Sphingomonas radiodurans]|uniref:HAD family hydrolase n=1 Tax=Sphingomonas radiodurans TaxID=2890321 RepID=UPI001E37D963|nr:HAD family hydrolase [Sphingomonas radiodurans]WBH16229.1 HAD family hydrolase [Sphingomonas radiodurans]
MAIRAVLFDIDGTLVDSNDLHVIAWQEAFASIGERFERSVIHDQIGKGTDMLVPTLLPDADQATQDALGEAHGSNFKERFLAQVKPFPGAHDLLARVHADGKKVVLASSASAEELEHYTGLLDARDLVDATTSADDVENTKPAPDIFATALKKIAPLTAEEVIVVGDTPYDVEAAGKCGIATIALRSGGFPDSALREAGAVALYDDVAALLRDYQDSPLAE